MFNLCLEKLQKDRRKDTLKVCRIIFKVLSSYFSHSWVLGRKGPFLHTPPSLLTQNSWPEKITPINQQATALPHPAGPALPFSLGFLAHPLLFSSSLRISLIPHHRCTELDEKRPPLFLCLEERRECSERTHEWLCLVKLPRCAAMGMTSTRLIYLIECYANKRFTFCPLALLMYPREKLAFGHRAQFSETIKRHRETLRLQTEGRPRGPNKSLDSSLTRPEVRPLSDRSETCASGFVALGPVTGSQLSVTNGPIVCWAGSDRLLSPSSEYELRYCMLLGE